MEKSIEAVMREGLGKRGCPDPEVESHRILGLAVMREGLRKRDCPDPEVESHRILGLAHESHEEKSQQIRARLAVEDAFWDDLEKSYGARPVRDADHAEAKASSTKMDLAAEEEEAEAAAAWSDGEEEDYDDPDRQALEFRKRWNYVWSGTYGSFEDITLIPPMRYTDEPLVQRISPTNSLQIFSAKIAGIGGGFQWPLDVFGVVAVRDSIDRKRNIIFQRSRAECQTLTEKDPYLVLTGPTRAVDLTDPATIELYLKVKGPTELEDKTLCFLAKDILSSIPIHSCLLHETWIGKFSTVEFILGHIVHSVEATISVRVVDGSWPVGFHGQFAACMVSTGGTSSIDHDYIYAPPFGRRTSVNHKKIVLLSFGDDKVPVTGDGVVELSRRVVSTGIYSKLKISVKAWQDDNKVVEAVEEFTAKEADRSFGTLEIGSCKMDVIVAWSLIADIQGLVEELVSEFMM